MDFESDRHFARALQSTFDMEMQVENPTNNLVYDRNKKKHQKQLNSSQSLIDPSWELVDPTPDIHVLFVAFNQRFFWNKLGEVVVVWSKKMTTCAGVCSYEGRGGRCTVALSEPLLKLRPRKDLVETLLHEMIHALLFVTHNNKDRDGHGPEFHKHMYRINKETGTNITVYHDFYDEVDFYQKQHVWRCDGPCKNQRPYYGFVKRATNRAPGPYDRWWSRHKMNCGGTFIKVKEPEKKTRQKKETKADIKAKELKNITSDIRGYFKVPDNDFVKTLKDFPNNTSNSNKENVRTGLANIVTINDLKNENNNNSANTNKNSFKNLNDQVHIKTPEKVDYSLVRNQRLKLFDNTTISNQKNTNRVSNKQINSQLTEIKRKASIIERSDEVDKKKSKNFKEITPNKIVNKLTETQTEENLVNCPICNRKIEQNLINTHLDTCLNEAEMKELNPPNKEVITINDEKEMVECEICHEKIDKETSSHHISECLNKMYDDIESKYGLKESQLEPEPEADKTTACLVCGKKIVKQDLNLHLETCMEDVFDGDVKEGDNCDPIDDDDDISDGNKIRSYNCPICTKLFPEDKMNDHIDQCLDY